LWNKYVGLDTTKKYLVSVYWRYDQKSCTRRYVGTLQNWKKYFTQFHRQVHYLLSRFPLYL